MRRTKEEAEQTRRDILKSAIEVFSKKGFASSTLVDIAKKANVTRGAIYWHFKNKNDLFEALVGENERKVNTIIEQIKETESDPLLGLQKGLSLILKKVEEDPDYRAIEQLYLKNKFSGEIDFFLTHKREREDSEGFCHLRDIFEKHKAQSNSDYNIENAIKVLGCFFYGALIMVLNTPKENPFFIGDKIDDVVELFFNGIKNKQFE